MNSKIKFHHSRIWALCTFKWWRHLIFPKRIIISDTGIETFERLGVITFWRKEVEKMPASKLASVVVKSGFIWDTVKIETSGGSNPIELKGYSKLKAKKFSNKVQELLEKH